MRLLEPLRERDFALLWAGLTVSLLGDGIYFVAVAFQAYALKNEPSSLAVVALSWSAGFLVAVLVAGVVSDRIPRRRVMMGADVVRAAALLAIGLLSMGGALELWMLVALVFIYGIGEAFFGPAFSALIPEILPERLLVQANALEHAMRPISARVVGPAFGGLIVGLAGAGQGFVIDAGTFVVSFACLSALRIVEIVPEPVAGAGRAVVRELREGLAYVRSQSWLWGTLVAASLSLLLFQGPMEVLIPYLFKNELGGGATAFGVFMAIQGVGWAAGSFWMGRRGMPDRPVRFMILWWGLGSLPFALVALVSARWQLMALAFFFGVPFSVGMVIWATLMQSRVPRELRGRVNSLDWFVSIGLLPVSFALTAPVSQAVGIDATFAIAGLGGGGVMLLLFALVPGLRERGEVVAEAGVGDGGGLHADHLDPLAAGEPGDGADHGQSVIPQRLDRPAP